MIYTLRERIEIVDLSYKLVKLLVVLSMRIIQTEMSDINTFCSLLDKLMETGNGSDIKQARSETRT